MAVEIIFLKLLPISARSETGTHPAFLLACPEGTKKKTAPKKVATERATARLKGDPGCTDTEAGGGPSFFRYVALAKRPASTI
jgi:hypothetical protein